MDFASIESKSNLRRYFNSQGYVSLNVFDRDGVDAYIENIKGFKRFGKYIEDKKSKDNEEGKKKKIFVPSDVKFSNIEIDYSSLNDSLKNVENRKSKIDKRINVMVNKKTSSFIKRVALETKDLFVKSENKNLEGLLNTQNTSLDDLDKKLGTSSDYLREDFYKLKDGFSNLCYYWMQADKLIIDHQKINGRLKYDINSLKFFSKSFFKNLKKRKELKSDYKKNEGKIAVWENKKNDLESSFEMYKLFLKKNKSDKLFLENLKRESSYYRQLLGFSGNHMLNFENDHGNSLESQEAKAHYFNVRF